MRISERATAGAAGVVGVAAASGVAAGAGVGVGMVVAVGAGVATGVVLLAAGDEETAVLSLPPPPHPARIAAVNATAAGIVCRKFIVVPRRLSERWPT